MTDSELSTDPYAKARFNTRVDPTTGEDRGWVELEVEGWCAAWRFGPGGAVQEMRIYPASARPRKRTDIGSLPSEDSDAPSGGISATHMRLFTPSLGRQILAAHPSHRRHQPAASQTQQTPPTRGVRTPDGLLAQVAVLYGEAVRERKRSPTQYIGDRLRQGGVNRADATIRDLIHRARKRGFLTETHSRRAGGTPTEKAYAVLRAQGLEAK